MNTDTKIRLAGLVGLGSIAVWLTLSLGSCLYMSLISLQWPAVPVQILSSGVSSGNSTLGRWWAPDVEYEYKIDGRTYHSINIRYWMPHFYDEESARTVEAAYPAHAEVKAAYDPRDPERSVLEPGVPSAMWPRALIPVFFWCLVGYIFYEIKHPARRHLLPAIPNVAEKEDSARKAA